MFVQKDTNIRKESLMFVFNRVLDNVSSIFTVQRVQTVLSQCNKCFFAKIEDVFIKPTTHKTSTFKF